jgi:hypothetical protein
VSCEFTIGIVDAHVAFQQPTEFQRPAGDVPDAVIDCLKADLCADAAM